MTAVRLVPVLTSAGERTDALAVEEPLEVRVTHHPNRRRFVLAVTLRTPGHDAELAAGLALADGLIQSADDLAAIHQDGPNAVRLELTSGVVVDPARHARSGYTSAACGVCGKTSIEAALRSCDPLPADELRISSDVLLRLPQTLRTAQPGFTECGGLHAAGLFTATGELLAAREDVGRHNAVDKLIGAALLRGELPLAGRLLCVSGRAGFELVQKAVVAGSPVLAAVGAASSLAVELAERAGLTLVGFVRDDRFTIYTGAGRLSLMHAEHSSPLTSRQ